MCNSFQDINRTPQMTSNELFPSELLIANENTLTAPFQVAFQKQIQARE